MKWRSGRARSWKRLLRWVECRGLRLSLPRLPFFRPFGLWFFFSVTHLPPSRANLTAEISHHRGAQGRTGLFRLRISSSPKQSAFAFRLLLFAPIVSTWETCLQDKVRRELLNGKRNRCDMWHGSRS